MEMVEVDYVQLGQNIKKYRRMANLTQEQLASMTGYSDSHIGQIENAYGIPSYEAVFKIAVALNVTLDQLSYGYTKNLDGYFIQEMLRISEQFDEKQKAFAIDMMIALAEQMQKHFALQTKNRKE